MSEYSVLASQAVLLRGLAAVAREAVVEARAAGAVRVVDLGEVLVGALAAAAAGAEEEVGRLEDHCSGSGHGTSTRKPYQLTVLAMLESLTVARLALKDATTPSSGLNTKK